MLINQNIKLNSLTFYSCILLFEPLSGYLEYHRWLTIEQVTRFWPWAVELGVGSSHLGRRVWQAVKAG